MFRILISSCAHYFILATLLQWPHDYGWDPNHVQRYEPIWVKLVKALNNESEKVRIIVYNRAQKKRVKNLLKKNGVDMGQVSLFNYPTDDVWICDNGPIFAFNKQGNMVIEDWIFNGWVSDISSTGAAPSVLKQPPSQCCIDLPVDHRIQYKSSQHIVYYTHHIMYDDYIADDAAWEFYQEAKKVQMVNEVVDIFEYF
jgi:hypothetical protein